MSFLVNFPNSEISAVAPKKAALKMRADEFQGDGSYDARRDVTLEPAIRVFTESNEGTLNLLTDPTVSGDKVANHRKCKLFFYKDVLDYVNVNQLRAAMREFVEGLPGAYPDNTDFYVGPNYIRDQDLYLLSNRAPIDPFTFLRVHNLILAAEKADFHRVTNITGLIATTKNGFNPGSFISSVWVANPKLVRDALKAGGEQAEQDVIFALQSKYGSWASSELFSQFLLRSLNSTKRVDQIWYGVTLKFAKALYAELEAVALANSAKIAPFSLMFLNEFSRSHDNGNRRVSALLEADGNLLDIYRDDED